MAWHFLPQILDFPTNVGKVSSAFPKLTLIGSFSDLNVQYSVIRGYVPQCTVFHSYAFTMRYYIRRMQYIFVVRVLIIVYVCVCVCLFVCLFVCLL